MRILLKAHGRRPRRLSEPGVRCVRRECEACGERFTTYERAEEPRVTVVKRDGRRERFDRQKLLRGLVRAAGRRPVSDEQLESSSPTGSPRACARAARSRPSHVGDLAERGLARIDPVSAIQFASVYRNLADLDELEAVVRRFKEEPLPASDQLALDGSTGPSDASSNIDLSPQGGHRTTAQPRRSHVAQP